MTAPGTRCCCARHNRFPCPQCEYHGYPADSAPLITKDGLTGAFWCVAAIVSVGLVVYLLAF